MASHIAKVFYSRLTAKRAFRILLLFGIIAVTKFVVQSLILKRGFTHMNIHERVGNYDVPAIRKTASETPKEMESSMADNGYDRRMCDRFNRPSNTTRLLDNLKGMSNIFVVDRLKLLFCYVPKVACTNWKRILMILQGDMGIEQKVNHMEVHERADNSLLTLARLNSDDIKRVMGFTKIVFVRDPFARLLSAYRDKLEEAGRIDSDRFRARWSSKIANRSQQQSYDVTFEEFAGYIANPANTLDDGEEEHWRPIHRLCKPCAIKYDFVGRFEELKRDVNYALKDVLHSNYTGGLINSTNFTNSSDSGLLTKYFSRLGPETIKGLYQRYQLDFELFGYRYPFPSETTDILGKNAERNADTQRIASDT